MIREKDQIFRLFCHEAQRVFHDRLINNEDKTYFNEMMAEMAQKYFATVSFEDDDDAFGCFHSQISSYFDKRIRLSGCQN